MPKLLSKEALLILIQGAFLVSRTFLTDRISRIEARAGRHLISQVPNMDPEITDRPSHMSFSYAQSWDLAAIFLPHYSVTEHLKSNTPDR